MLMDVLALEQVDEASALAGEPWITFPPRPGVTGEPYTTSLHQRLAACGLGDAEIIPVDSLTAQKRMVEAGFGLALLPESSLDEELRTKTLCRLRVPAMSTTIPVALIHRRRGYLSGAARRLIALLEAWRGNQPVRRRSLPSGERELARRSSAAAGCPSAGAALPRRAREARGPR